MLQDFITTGVFAFILTFTRIGAAVTFMPGVGDSLTPQNIRLYIALGFSLVIKKEPKTGFVSVKSQPKAELDLQPLYLRLKQADPAASWFFHQSRHIIVNGSRHNPLVKASGLSLQEIVDLVKQV